MFMAVLDVQVVAASLPDIRAALSIRPDQMSWIQTSYLIAEVVAITLTGLLTRALGLRRLAVLSIAAFVATSIGCAMSGTFGALLFWRVLQGLAGGLLIPQVFAAGFVLFPGRGQALATTIAGVLAVLAPTIGPFVGGWITDSFTWPWLFLINVAPGLAATAAVARFLPRQPAELSHLRAFDLLGFGLMVLALACLEIALKEAPRAGWRSAVILGLMAASLGAGALFVLRTRRAREPIVDLRALADRDFALGCALTSCRSSSPSCAITPPSKSARR
jgi:DHA2 family multidrug resistance protein